MTQNSDATFENQSPKSSKPSASAATPDGENATLQLLAVLVTHFEEQAVLRQKAQRAPGQEIPSIEKKPLPEDFMRLLKTMPREILIASVCELADSFVTAMAASREQVKLIGLTSFGMTPHQVEQLNLPTMLGSLMGKTLPLIDTDKVCATCAFRPGSAANQSASTLSDIWDCLDNEAPFMCHHGVHGVSGSGQSTQACRGFVLAKASVFGAAGAAPIQDDKI